MTKPLRILGTVLLSLLALSLQSQNYALSFDGVDDYVDLGPDAGNGIRTIELWFKPGSAIDSTLPGLMPLLQRSPLGCGTCHSVSLTFVPGGSANSGKLSCGIRNADGSVNNTVASDSKMWNSGQWYHCACVMHPTDGMMMFIDGVKQDEVEPAGVDASTTDTNIIALGRWGSLNDRFFSGRIDDVRLSYSPRYNTNFTPPCPGDLSADASTIALWHLEAGTGVTAADSSGNGYDGSIMGATWAVDTICISTGVAILETRLSLLLYPNPAATSLVIQTSGHEDIYTVLDAMGRRVHHGDISGDHPVDVSALVPGFYTLVVGTESARLLIE